MGEPPTHEAVKMAEGVAYRKDHSGVRYLRSETKHESGGGDNGIHSARSDCTRHGFVVPPYLDCLESLRNAVRTSDIQTTEDALVPCLELNSTDERTMHFVDWGRKVLEQFMLLESSCTEVLLTPTKEGL